MPARAVGAEGFGETFDDFGVSSGDIAAFRRIVGEIHETRAKLLGARASGNVRTPGWPRPRVTGTPAGIAAFSKV